MALQAVDIDFDEVVIAEVVIAEEFMQIFEDGVASASNPVVSSFSDAAVISMEKSNTVQVEDVNSRIVANLQECIVLLFRLVTGSSQSLCWIFLQ